MNTDVVLKITVASGALAFGLIHLLAALSSSKKYDCWKESDQWTTSCYAAVEKFDFQDSFNGIGECGEAEQRYIVECDTGAFDPFERHALKEPIPTAGKAITPHG